MIPILYSLTILKIYKLYNLYKNSKVNYLLHFLVYGEVIY